MRTKLIIAAGVALALAAVGGVALADDVEDGLADSVALDITEYDADGNETGNLSYSTHREIDSAYAWTWLEDENETESPYADYVSEENLTISGDESNVSQTADGWEFTDDNQESATADVNLTGETLTVSIELSPAEPGAFIQFDGADVELRMEDVGGRVLEIPDGTTVTIPHDEQETHTVALNETHATMMTDGSTDTVELSEPIDADGIDGIEMLGETSDGHAAGDLSDVSVFDRKLTKDEHAVLEDGHRTGDLSPPSHASDARDLAENDSIELHVSTLYNAEADIWIQERVGDDDWQTVEEFGSISSPTTVDWDVDDAGEYRYQTAYDKENVTDGSVFGGGGISGLSIDIPLIPIEITADNRNALAAGAAAVAALLFWIPGFSYFGRTRE